MLQVYIYVYVFVCGCVSIASLISRLFCTHFSTFQATPEDHLSYEMLRRHCKQASESCLSGNIKEAIYYFEEAQTLATKEKGVCYCTYCW